MIAELHDKATVNLPDGSTAHVPVHLLRRSHILYDACTDTSEVDNVVIHSPVKYFQSWLECAFLLESRGTSLAAAESSILVKYLSAADYFADEDAVATLCELLGQKLFTTEARNLAPTGPSTDAGGSAASTAVENSKKDEIEEVIKQLPENLAISLLRASESSLDTQMQRLLPSAHILAVHAAFPSILQDGTLLIDCSVYTTAAASAALRAASAVPYSELQGDRHCELGCEVECATQSAQASCLLSSLHVRSLALRGSTNTAEKSFTWSLCHALRAATKHVSITGAEISDLHFQTILSALADNTSLESLEIVLLDSLRAREPPLAAVIAHGLAQLTGLKSLTLRNMPERADFHLPRTLQPLSLQTTFQCLTRLTQLQLDSSIQCVEGVSSFLSHLVHLKTLELSVYTYLEHEVEALAAALTHLTGLRNLICAGEGYAVLPALESSRLEALSKLDLDLSSGATDDALQTLVCSVRNMHGLQELALRVPSLGGGDSAVALLDTLQNCPGLSSLVLRGVHVGSAGAGLSMCRKLAALTSLQYLHLHTAAVFVPAKLSGTHARAVLGQDERLHASGYPPSPLQQNIDTWPLLRPVAGYVAMIGTASSYQQEESRSSVDGAEAGTSFVAGYTGIRKREVSVQELQKGPLPFLTQLTHLTLRESSDWSRLESSLRDFSEPLQPLTAFLLRGLSSLRKLRYLEIDDDLQDGSSQQLAKSLASAFSRMPQLESVRLLSCNMSAPAAHLIAAPLSCAALTHLNLNRAFWDQQGVKEVAPALQKLVHLRDLTIVGDAYFQMTADCAAAVASSLRTLSSLQRFTMTCCRFAEGGLEALAPGLSNLTALHFLDLSFNSILDIGMESLGPSLLNLVSLQSLILSDNELTSIGTKGLVRAVSHLQHLRCLDLSHNPIDNEGAYDLAELLSCRSSLRTVDVACSRMSTAGEKVLLEALSEDDPMRCSHLFDASWILQLCGFEADEM